MVKTKLKYVIPTFITCFAQILTARTEGDSCWAGATHDSLWAWNRVRKWGRSSPTQCHPASNLTFLSCATSSYLGTCSITKMTAKVTDRVICVVHAPVTFLGCGYGSRLFKTSAPTPLRGLENGKAQ